MKTSVRVWPAAIVALAMFTAAGAAAAPRSTLRVPQGAQVSVKGNAVALMSNGATGTYNCKCSGRGLCAVDQQPSIITCKSDAKTPCNSACELDTTTNPKATAAAAAIRGSSATTRAIAP